MLQLYHFFKPLWPDLYSASFSSFILRAYKTLTSNNIGYVKLYTIAISDKAEIEEFVVKDHKEKENIIVNENDTVIFVCSAVGKPNASVELKKGVDNIHKPVPSNLEYTLHISSCRDTGNYTCFGNNTLFGEHTHQSRIIRLFVNCKYIR